MIGLVLVTHGKLAEEFRHALEHVVGPQKAIETVCIGPEDDMDQRRQEFLRYYDFIFVWTGNPEIFMAFLLPAPPARGATSSIGTRGLRT